MNLLVGLGNPGARHLNDRHNIGFMALENIAEQYKFSSYHKNKRFYGDLSEGKVNNKRVIALKPSTYMNNSGKSVAATSRFYKIPPDKVIIIHDELDLKPGKIKAKLGGGDAGHNGLKSISEYIGSNYWRVRIGIGKPLNKTNTKNYVLSSFEQHEKEWLAKILGSITTCIPDLLEGDANKFLTKASLTISNPILSPS